MIKAIFFDVDGTLVPSGGQRLPAETLSALQTLRRSGIRLFVATGRHISMLDGIRQDFEFDGYATMNGQHCTCSGLPVARNPIPPQGVCEIVEAAREEQFSCIFLEAEELWTNMSNGAARAFLEEFNVATPPTMPLERALEREIYQVIVLLSPRQEHLLLDRANHLTTTRWHPGFLDALAPGGGKATGVQAVLDHLGLTADEVMAFGDGGNDISMLQLASVGVATGNAGDHVKAAADYVCPPVEEQGVLEAFRHFGLIE